MPQIVMLGIGIGISIIAYFLKRAFAKLDAHEYSISEIKTTCAGCNSRITNDIVQRIEKMMDEKLDAWWLKVENGLMNEGRLPPRRSKKD